MTSSAGAYREMQVPDMDRRIADMIRIGTVSELDYSDPAAPRVRVQYGKNTTGWIPWSAARAGRARTWQPLSIGEQVIIVSPSGDLAQGVIVGSINYNSRQAPASGEHQTVTEWDGGIREEIDDEGDNYRLTVPAGGSVTITVGGTEFELTESSVRVKTDTLTVEAQNSTFHGPVHFTDQVTGDQDIKAQGVSLLHHVHGNTMAGPGNSGQPVNGG